MMKLHDTASGALRELVPVVDGQVSMYVCGPTVYDHPHLGHGRFSLVFDVLRRYLEWSGYDVKYVSNVTDIDDNIINRANRESRSWQEVVDEFESVWWSAMDALGVKRPDSDPHATSYVEKMVALIADLIERDAAYVLEDGVYFSVEAAEGYGLLARQSLDSLRSGSRVEVLADKRSPLDFVLWKFAKPGEPAWPSPWGEGRPGWHTECVVMSTDLLGSKFDIHGGGQDLAFPHHENERAQAKACGKEFAQLWVHNGFVEVEGEKMSKSLGNFTTLTELLEHVDPRAYRMLVLRCHYRSPVEVTRATLEDATRALERIDDSARRAAQTVELAEFDSDVEALEVLDQFRQAMDNDLDTPGAVAVVFDSIRRFNSAIDTGDFATAAKCMAAIKEMLVAVGLVARDGQQDDVDETTRDLMIRRDEARSARNFALADSLRDELVGRGWTVSDTPSGTRVHR